MNIFKIISGEFIICLGIILLLCGLIMLYVKQRFASYDRHLMEQSQLLKHVVATIETNANANANALNSMHNQKLASSIALDAAKRISQNAGNSSENKIVVSDDETSENSGDSSSDDNDDDSSSVDDSEPDSDDESEQRELDAKTKKLLKAQNRLTMDVLAGLPHKPSNSQSSSDDAEIDLDLDIDEDSSNSSESDSESDSDNDNDNDNGNNKVIKLVEVDNSSLTIDQISPLNLDVNNVCDDECIASSSFIDELHVTKLNDESPDLEVKDVNAPNLKKIVTKIENSIDKNNTSNLKDMKKQQLQDLCKERNLNINGTRLELIKRLSE